MSATVFAAILLAIFLLLVLTRRKTHAGRRGKDYWQSREVKFRTEDKPPVDARKARGLEAALADDVHGKFGEAATSALVARAAFDDKRKHYILQNVYIPTHAG